MNFDEFRSSAGGFHTGKISFFDRFSFLGTLKNFEELVDAVHVGMSQLPSQLGYRA